MFRISKPRKFHSPSKASKFRKFRKKYYGEAAIGWGLGLGPWVTGLAQLTVHINCSRRASSRSSGNGLRLRHGTAVASPTPPPQSPSGNGNCQRDHAIAVTSLDGSRFKTDVTSPLAGCNGHCTRRQAASAFGVLTAEVANVVATERPSDQAEEWSQAPARRGRERQQD